MTIRKKKKNVCRTLKLSFHQCMLVKLNADQYHEVKAAFVGRTDRVMASR